MMSFDYDPTKVEQKQKKSNTKFYKYGMFGSIGIAIAALTFLGRTQVDLNIANSKLEQEKSLRRTDQIQANKKIYDVFCSNFTDTQFQESAQAWKVIESQRLKVKQNVLKDKWSFDMAMKHTAALDSQEIANLKAESATRDSTAVQKTHDEWLEAVQQIKLSNKSTATSALIKKSQENFVLSDAQLDEKTKAIHFKFEPQY